MKERAGPTFPVAAFLDRIEAYGGRVYLVPGGDVMATKVCPADRELIAVHERAIRRHLLDAALRALRSAPRSRRRSGAREVTENT